ncbi:DsbA family oxidoreductase [Bdellovibrio sp. HCB-162]|uniref:DsbA family oxidoreductase n=1 Tax=Bdellovibrio sp. HCB-162 TaxID=3394234 RepID=UPI0039BC6D3D
MKKKIVVEAVVDIVCPWCFVGKKSLLDAVAQSRSEFDIEVRFLPFQLDASTPREGVSRSEYLKKKFGSDSRFQAAEEMVQKAAKAAGTEIHFEKMHVHINTFDCHRLIWWATQDGKQVEVTTAIYDAYFVKGEDLSKIENLKIVMSRAGYEPQKVEEFLKSSQGTQEVQNLIEETYNLGVSGVPFFILNREIGISGAQPKEIFLQAFQETETHLED